MQTSKSKSAAVFLRMFGYGVLLQIWEASHSEEKHKQPLARLCRCVWVYARLSNLPISPRDTVVSSQSSFSFSDRRLMAGEHRSGSRSRLCPRCPVVWGQAASVPYLHDPHASQDKASIWSLCCGSVMLIQLPSGRDIQLLSLVDIFQIYCMTYLPLVTNTQVCKSTQLTTTMKIFIFDSYCYSFCRLMLLSKKQQQTNTKFTPKI